MPAAVQLAPVGKHPCSSTKVRKAMIPSSSRRSDSSVSATASPSNTPGGFVLWELRSTNCPLLHNADPHNADPHNADACRVKLSHRRSFSKKP